MSTDPREVANVNIYNVPSFAKKMTYDKSEMAKSSKPPFIKIIEHQSKPPYKPPFNNKDMVLVPHREKLGDENTPLVIVPIHFFKTFTCINPYEARNLKLPVIREITYDENSELAKKCKTFVKDIPCPEMPTEMLKFSQVLNFIVLMEDHSKYGQLPIWLFCNRGRFTDGQTLLGMILARPTVPYICRFRISTKDKTGPEGNWVGFDFYDDPVPYVMDEEKAKMYEQLSKDYAGIIGRKELDFSEVAETLQESVTPADAANEKKF